MAAIIYNIELSQGVSDQRIFQFKQPSGDFLNLTGFTGKSEIRTTAGGTLVAEFDVQIAGNEVILSLDSSTTASLKSGLYVWDLLLADSLGSRDRYVQGTVKINATVTKW